jgi:cyclic pyranopterin phosphate synthase
MRKMTEFSHIKDDRVHMVDVSAKGDLVREALATGRITLRSETIEAIQSGIAVKGNVLATARVAAISAVKETSRLIPMCHPLLLSSIEADFSIGSDFIQANVRVRSLGRTGVEMEAITGVSVGLLTVWDMVKSAEKDNHGQYPVTRIDGIRVVEKKKSEPGES